MIKLRIKFKRDDELRFLSHLDQMRMFTRAFRRAHLPIAFSQGFNPHPIMSFANALSVGMTSDCEYIEVGLDLEDTDSVNTNQILKKLRKVVPKGIRIEEIISLPKNSKSLTRLIDSADYDVICLGLHVSDIDEVSRLLEQFNKRDEIILTKKNKKGRIVNHNIRKNFENIEAFKDGKDVIFRIKILPIDGSLLNPETIIRTFLNEINYYDNSLNILTHRRNLSLKEE